MSGAGRWYNFGFISMSQVSVRPLRSENEVAAGGLFPLLGQQAAGFPRGTFDLHVRDDFKEGVDAFRDQYPFLLNHEIRNGPLVPLGPVRIMEDR